MSKRGVIVDGKDNPIGSKNWWEIDYGDIYRCSVLWLTDIATGDVLLAQRTRAKKHDPGKWGAAAAGTIEENETYESNMIKEIEEEIGLTGLELTLGPKKLFDDGAHRFFCQWFFTEADKSKITFRLEEKEVEAVQWTSKEALIKDVQDNPQEYVSTMAASLSLLGLMITKTI
jgi:8-oxo-dGTP pyrophosphatase MutT (NUDIX family)